MRHYCLVPGRLNKVVRLAAIFLLTLTVSKSGAQSQTAPAITVTVNKSMVFRLAERAKRVSVSQPEVADVLVVAPSQLLINGKNVGTTSLIIFDEKGEVSNYDLIVAPDISALRGQLRAIFPNEKIDISTSRTVFGPARGGVQRSRLRPGIGSRRDLSPAQASRGCSTFHKHVFYYWSESSRTDFGSGVGFASGGTLAFTEETSITDTYRWSDKKKIDGVIDLLVIREIRQIELDVIVADVSMTKLREVGLDIFQNYRNVGFNSLIGSNAFGLLSSLNIPAEHPPQHSTFLP